MVAHILYRTVLPIPSRYIRYELPAPFPRLPHASSVQFRMTSDIRLRGLPPLPSPPPPALIDVYPLGVPSPSYLPVSFLRLWTSCAFDCVRRSVKLRFRTRRSFPN